MELTPSNLTLIGLAFALSVGLTAAVRALARRWGIVAAPKADRWHRKPTALLGGVGIFITVAAIYLALMPQTSSMLAILTGSAFLWLVGLVDDLRQIKPYQKLIGQLMGTAIVLSHGLTLPWTQVPVLNAAVTIFWLVGITNAINLLDNMDGLAAGIAGIAGVFLGIHFVLNGQQTEALVLFVFAAALAGFLVFNSNPASIFMGDCGSMFIGFFLAGVALLSTATRARSQSLLPVLAVPVLALFIPIFDTTFVTVLRKLAGRSPARGGRDHTSHRLVALGLSERKAVGLMYALATLAGLLALLVNLANLDIALAAVLAFTVVLTFLGVHLAGVKVYSEQELRAAREQPLVAFLIDLSYKRRLFEVLLDVALVMLAYQFACILLLFEGISSPAIVGWALNKSVWEHMLAVAPILVFVNLPVFLVMGVYRGLWRYVSVHNLPVYARAAAVGAAASAVAIRLLQPARPPAVVFVLDGLVLFVLLAASRFAFRLFRSLLPPSAASKGRRVLIYGAGDGGVLLLRELRNNHDLRCSPIGFADDDPLKKGRVIHGLMVFGGNGSFLKICARHKVDEVVISGRNFSEERLREIQRDCARAQIALKRMRLQIEPVEDALLSCPAT